MFPRNAPVFLCILNFFNEIHVGFRTDYETDPYATVITQTYYQIQNIKLKCKFGRQIGPKTINPAHGTTHISMYSNTHANMLQPALQRVVSDSLGTTKRTNIDQCLTGILQQRKEVIYAQTIYLKHCCHYQLPSALAII